MKNEIIKELQYFKGVEFHEEQHFYTLDDYKFGISATSLIETYAQKFDSDSISQMVANKRHISQQEVLNEWKKENEFSCAKGSCIHLKAQSLWMNTNYEIDYNAIDENMDKNRLKKEYDIMSKQAINFYNDYKDMYDMIQDEFIVWSKEFDIAGSIDGIMYNKYTQQCCILDFKSNKDLQFESKYHKKMKVPLHKLDDVNGQHYYLQLSIYKYLIEKYTNIKIDELFIVYFNVNAKNYEVIPIPYLKNEVEEILEIRRKKGMKCIPVLIMGASGTGKTFSFKNLPAEHTGIISVVKPKLPFRNKNKLSFYQCDNYEEIKQIIQKTDKKIICIDDTGYLMQFENFDKALIKGYDKHTEMAKHYADLLKVVRNLEGEKIVYLTIHEDVIEGISKPKTTGKMINDNLCIEGLFDIVFRSLVKENEHVFQTRSSGESVAKTPYEMFDEEFIPNDLLEIDKTIREFYEFEPLKINNNKNESEDK